MNTRIFNKQFLPRWSMHLTFAPPYFDGKGVASTIWPAGDVHHQPSTTPSLARTLTDMAPAHLEGKKSQQPRSH